MHALIHPFWIDFRFPTRFIRCCRHAFSAVVLVSLTALFMAGAVQADPDKFSHPGISKDADRYESFIKKNWKAGSDRPGVLRLRARRVMASDPRAASRGFASAVVMEERNPENWIGLAESLLAIKPDPANTAERYDLPVNASGAAYRAYHLYIKPEDKALALHVLANALQRRAYWRPAIEALKISLAHVEVADVRKMYEDLRAQHGFRMMDYATESDVAEPRICIRFSELLSRQVEDFATYTKINGKDPEVLTAEKKQLCFGNVTHGERYKIQIRAGLPSDIGEALLKNLDLAIYVPDRKPFVRFTGKAYVLPAIGQQGIPLVSVNTKSVDISVYRIGDRNLSSELERGGVNRQLSGYDLDQIRSRSGSKVYSGKMDVALDLNAEVTTAFPVSDVLGTLKPGAYVMTAWPTGRTQERWRSQPTQWFIVSDLGLTAFTGKDGVHTFVRSLASADPMGDVRVRLMARNNEILATATSNADGYAKFDHRLARGEGGLAPALLVAETKAGAYAFLNLSTNAFDLSDRGVKGRAAPGPIDGYLYTERGVYRPGDEVNLTALVRDAAGVAVSAPTTLIISRPDGVEHQRMSLSDQGLGGRAHALWLSDGAMTGTWRAKLFLDPSRDAIAQLSFLVEDFQPERLDLTLNAGDKRLVPGGSETVSVKGRYLYGPPAANLVMEGEVIVRPSKRGIQGFKGFHFGLQDQTVTQTRKALDGLGKTDGHGHAQARITLPKIPKTVRPLEAKVLLRLREPGGRTIERATLMPVDPGAPRIGLKPDFEANGLKENTTAAFDVVVLDENNTPKPEAGLRWALYKLETSWQWYSANGQWHYEPQTLTRKVSDGKLDVTSEKVGRISTPVRFGRYRLTVTSADKTKMATNYMFHAGWHTANTSADSPELLDVALDKATYAVGDIAKLRIASRHAGKAMIAVIGNGLHATQQVVVSKGDNEFSIPVGENWGAGAYATALLYRPLDQVAKRMPARSVGIKWLGIDQNPRTLSVALSVPAKVKSGAKLEVPIAIKGLNAGEKAFVTVAAVDIGILNVTDFKSPQPQSHFYAQHRLAMEIRDLYGRLIDGMRAERGVMRSGGDAGAAMNTAGAPPVEKTIAFYSGLVRVDHDGKATVSFNLPDFNGAVRLMAVAWSKTKLGSASQNVLVRDAIALTASAPRFLTLGDDATIQMNIHNVEASEGQYNLSLSVSGDPLATPVTAGQEILSRAITLKKEQQRLESLSISPKTVGLKTYTVRVTGPNDVDVARELTFDVKPPSQDIKRTTVSSIAGNGGTLTLSKDLVADMIANETTINVSVGPTARLDVPALLTSLDRYPYGCAEQTISRALPLLYVNTLSKDLGLADDKTIKVRIQKAIDRVFEMQNASGSFGVWGPGSADIWLTGYIMDFMTRAKEQGFAVKKVGYHLALDRLQNFVLNASDFKKGGASRAYALYVLARNARAPIGELRYYADARIGRFSTSLAKAQIGAALAMMGETKRAQAAFANAYRSFDIAAADKTRRDYGSSLRDGAALLTLASETRITAFKQPELLDVVASAYQARSFTSTQEQAWLLLAAHALSEKVKATDLAMDGAPVSGGLNRVIKANALSRDIVIANNGSDRVDAVVSVVGASVDPQPAAEHGFKISRKYFTLDGAAIDLASATGGDAQVAQNDRFVSVVTIESDEARGNILLADRLPAGFQVENPRLVDSGDVQSLSWLKTQLHAKHTAFRDDRVVAAFDLSQLARRAQTTANRTRTPDAAVPTSVSVSAAYIVRAVTPGSFVHPAATVEDMYHPERYARTGTGRLTVTPQQDAPAQP